MSEDKALEHSQQKSLGEIAAGLALVAAISVAIVIGAAIYLIAFGNYSANWQKVLFANIATIVGVPLAAAFSFSLVVFLRQTSGPVEFKGLGFSFQGASGQVVMWVLCFLALVSSIKLLWVP